MLNFCDFIQVYVFTTNHHLKVRMINFELKLYTRKIWFRFCFPYLLPGADCRILTY